MSADQQRRILIQAHALRVKATEAAVRHGGGEARSSTPFAKLLFATVVLALAIVVGLLAADMIIDMLTSKRR